MRLEGGEVIDGALLVAHRGSGRRWKARELSKDHFLARHARDKVWMLVPVGASFSGGGVRIIYRSERTLYENRWRRVA